ncbi:MAG: Transporter [Candidatus Ozemobacter sibiricus]|uniref:Transporter n=1 Tax=Candidatus Ozemobacter sibiricus TaxID=2268124 RepID=A0A367ZSY5_9BACT|nr:MAG: Transporter [Candidatus Ozemobacter sibiricus]
MNWKDEWKTLLTMILVFLGCYYLPVGTPRFDQATMEALHLVKWYAREHVLLCLVPAFFIAGAITIFISQASVMKYLGPHANPVLAYAVASVSGSILAVCSCTVLPLFNGIYKMGAGLGPACTFLYSGPAINVLAIIMSARVLGMDLGIARAIGAIGFSIVIGGLMHLIFRDEEEAKASAAAQMPAADTGRPLWHNLVFFGAMIGVLVFANWGKPQSVELTLRDGAVIIGDIQEEIEGAPDLKVKIATATGRAWAPSSVQAIPLADIVQRSIPDSPWKTIWRAKWAVTAAFALALLIILGTLLRMAWWRVGVTLAAGVIGYLASPDDPLVPFVAGVIALSAMTSTADDETRDWFVASWDNAKMILPLLLGGVLVAGLLLGRVGHEGLIPSAWVTAMVGGNSLFANLFASVFGAFMYFATLTEVPIVQGLIGSGMGKGPALALLLAGPALSLPNMLVIWEIMGTKKTLVFVSLVIVMATLVGLLFGAFFG